MSHPRHQETAVLNKQEQALIKIYKAMPTEEIEARLAGPDLIQLARGVAQNELQKREAAAAKARIPLTTGQKQAAATVAVGSVVVGCLLTWQLARWLDSAYANLFLFLTLSVLAQVLGKAFPLLGKVIGGLLLAAAVYAVVHFFKTPMMREERFLFSIFGLFGLIIVVGMAGSFISGAQNDKEWDEFADELGKQQQKTTDSIR